MADIKLSGRFLNGIKRKFKTKTKCDTWNDTPEDISKHDSAKLLHSKWLHEPGETSRYIESVQYANGKDCTNKPKPKLPKGAIIHTGKSSKEIFEMSLPVSLHQNDRSYGNGARPKHSKQANKMELKRTKSQNTTTEENNESSDNEEEALLDDDYTSDYETMPKEIVRNDSTSEEEDQENFFSTFSKSGKQESLF